MNRERRFTILEKIAICYIAVMHLLLVTPITEILPIVKKIEPVSEAHAQTVNNAPVIYSINSILTTTVPSVTLQSKDEGETVLIEPQVYDEDGDHVSLTFINLVKLAGAEEPVSVAGFEETGIWQTTNEDAGDFRATISADDFNGGISTKDVFFSINDLDNLPVVNLTLDPISVNQNTDFNIKVDVNDADIASVVDDVSDSNHSLVYQGSASCDATQAKFGTASLSLNGTNSYVAIPDSDDFNLGMTFTIDLWVRFNSVPTNLIGLCGQYSSERTRWRFAYQGGDKRIGFFNEGGGTPNMQWSWSSAAPNTWYHIALSRTGSNWYCFVNGKRLTQANSTNPSGDTTDIGTNFNIGWDGQNGRLNGRIDEFRISKGIARWTSDFTPPGQEYTSVDSYTKLLAHFDIGSGSPLEPMILIDNDPISDTSGIPQYIYGSGSFTKRYRIGSTGTYEVTARLTDPSSGATYEDSTNIEVTASSGINDIFPVSGDFNKDGLTDLGTWNKTNDTWSISISEDGKYENINSWSNIFGSYDQNQTFPLMGDYNADSNTDIGLFDSSNGKWKFALYDADTNSFNYDSSWDIEGFGQGQNHMPISGDFNGDGLTDIGYAHYLSEEGNFSIRLAKKDRSGFKEEVLSHKTHLKDSKPYAVDVNGDGLTDIAAFAKDTGNWHVLLSKGASSEKVESRTIFHGTTYLATEQKKLGSSALFLKNGDRNYISHNAHEDFDFSTEDWTVDFWVYYIEFGASHGRFALFGESWEAANKFGFGHNQAENHLGIWLVSSNSQKLSKTWPWTASKHTWYHIEVSRNGSEILCFVNGTKLTPDAMNPDIGTNSFNSGYDFNVRGLHWGGGYGDQYGPDMYIDEFRLSKGICRHTDNFTPSQENYTEDKYTKLLLHFDLSDDISENFAPSSQWISSFGRNQTPVIRDYNHDGKTDIGYFDKSTGRWYIAYSKGSNEEGGFERGDSPVWPSVTSGWPANSGNENIIPMGGDISGDAIGDAMAFDKSKQGTLNKWKRKIHNSKLPDLLVEIDNGIGGKTTIEYEVTTKLDNKDAQGKERLPFPVRVVKKVTKTDGLGHSYETSYEYAKGVFETDSREFRGFGYVKVVDPENHYKETTFLQDDVYKGRPDKEVVYDKYNRKIQETAYNWQSIQYHTGQVTFPYLDTKTTTLYDYKTSDFKEMAVHYEYDEYGNTIKVRNEGFLDKTGDEKETNITYEYNVAKWIVSKPKTSETTGNPVIKSQYTYDDNGSLFKEEKWLDTESKWITTDFIYDPYGNVKTVKDARNHISITTYDTDTHTFPISVENALGHTQTFTYDDPINKAIGKMKTSIDSNGQTTTSIYDNFGRLTKVTGPGGISEVTYAYDLTSTPVKISTTTKVSDTDSVTSHSWADGLGRTIEAISEADDGKYILSGLVKYDSRGQVIEKYLPVYVTGTDYVAPTFEGKHVDYQYDPLGRVTQTIRPDNKVSQNIYAITAVETINENAQRKRIEKDAYGRIIKVEEISSGATYTTLYEYDTLDNLIKTTDTLGNIATIKFDSLDHKNDINDPDMGVWAYSYDDVGNLVSQTDAKGQVITFDYDDINRLTCKSTGVTYTYDQGTNSKGRLSKVEDSSGITEFFYDILGREVKTIKTIDSTSYTIEREYDSLDRLTSIKYPDGVIVKYIYNKQGGIKKVYSPGTGGDVVYVNSTAYSANSQITHIEYGNGTSTDYTYDENNLRLTNLNTLSGTTPIQDLSYTFDPVGNIRQITDAVNSNTQSFSYDDLNRLTSATGPHYSTINYEYSPIGNLTKKGDKSLVYGEGAAGPHAVTKYGDTVIAYDANGNMEIKRLTNYTYDSENRLREVAIPRGGEVSNITLNFDQGWNFFSLPYKLIDQDGTLTPVENIPIGALLTDINGKYDQISKYDEAIDDPNTGHWQHYVGNSKFDQFSYFRYGDGYLIYTNTVCSLTLTGSTPGTTQQKTLNNGWNLVLSPTSTSVPVQDTLEGVTYTSVKHYNGTTYDDAATFEAGEAYWIRTASIQAWDIKAEEDITQFVYDGDGGRTKRIFEDRTTIYIGSSYEIQIDNTTQDVIKYKKLIQMGSTRVCEIEQIGDDIHAYFVHADHISSSNTLTDETGSRVSLFEYKPFGSVAYAAEDNTYDTDKKFTGKTYDKTTDLHYYGARYYDSELGRFITADPTIQHPYDPQDFNRYSYARNNPVKYIDPTGYFWLGVIIGAIIGAIVGGMAAHNAGGNVWAGIAIGAVIGAAVGGMSSYVGGIMMEGFGATGWAGLSIGQGALIGATTGAISGFGMGVAAGYAGGKGSASSMLQSGGSGAMWGAASGAATGAASTALSKATSNLPSASQEVAKEGAGKGDFNQVKKAVVAGSNKPSGASGNDVAEVISNSARSGGFGSGEIVEFDLGEIVVTSGNSENSYFSLTYTELDCTGKGYVYNPDGTMQPTRTLGSFGGVSYSANFGFLPSSEQTTGALNISASRFIGVSFFFTNPDVQPTYGGLSISVGMGFETPVSISGTYPESSPRWP